MDKLLILSKIKEHLNLRYDKEFADFLGVKTTTLAMWHKRNTYDIELIFNKCEFLSAEWLLTGKGSMLKSNVVPVAQEVDNKYKELADARLDVIDGLKFKIATLEKTIADGKYTQKETFLHKNMDKPAPELVGNKHK
jgi:hypothetical protein